MIEMVRSATSSAARRFGKGNHPDLLFAVGAGTELGRHACSREHPSAHGRLQGPNDLVKQQGNHAYYRDAGPQGEEV